MSKPDSELNIELSAILGKRMDGEEVTLAFLD